MSCDITWRPRQDSNLRHRLRRPVLYPLSYEGSDGHRRYTGASQGAISTVVRAVAPASRRHRPSIRPHMALDAPA